MKHLEIIINLLENKKPVKMIIPEPTKETYVYVCSNNEHLIIKSASVYKRDVGTTYYMHDVNTGEFLLTTRIMNETTFIRITKADYKKIKETKLKIYGK